MNLRSTTSKLHNTSVIVEVSSTTAPSRSKRPSSPSLSSPQKSKKLKLQASFTTQSPFPDYPHPTPAEALEVHNLLAFTHRPNERVIRRPPQASSNSAQTCGNVPNVIEAVIGTILSQNTSSLNCSRAKQQLDKTFGKNNFEQIANAPKQRVVDAIKSGGLANKKADMIQKLLKDVKEKHGVYSLQHLAGVPKVNLEGDEIRGDKPTITMTDEEIMQELLSYDGVGPKTASCVLLFCLGRDSFAVDTHVYRLSRLLGWVPAKADRILTQAHLDLRVPAELKYGLHTLMIQHGRVCKGCKRPGSAESCILKTYLKEKRIKPEAEEEINELDVDEHPLY